MKKKLTIDDLKIVSDDELSVEELLKVQGGQESDNDEDCGIGCWSGGGDCGLGCWSGGQ